MIHPNHLPVLAHDLSQRNRVGSWAASDIEDCLAGLQMHQSIRPLFVLLKQVC
jgi:hypothetical protein